MVSIVMSVPNIYFVEKVHADTCHVTERMTYRNDVYPASRPWYVARSPIRWMDDDGCWGGTGRKLEEMLRGYRRGMRMRGVTTVLSLYPRLTRRSGGDSRQRSMQR